jgi:hypothetical protein
MIIFGEIGGMKIWQGKPKYSEKTCPSATLSTTKSHKTDPGLEPRTAAVGSQRLTAWAMARPFLVPFCRLLRLAGSRWRYSTPPPHGLNSGNIRRTYSWLRWLWVIMILIYHILYILPLPSKPILGKRPRLKNAVKTKGTYLLLYRLKTSWK